MRLLFALILISFCFVTTSCTKTETKTVTVTDTVTKTVTVTDTVTVKPPITIVGFWVGTYQVTGSSTSYYISFDLRPDGALLYKGIGADGLTYYGQGTYAVTGNNFSYSFTTLNFSQNGTVQNSTGTYTATSGTITGNWQNEGTTISGSYSIAKSQ